MKGKLMAALVTTSMIIAQMIMSSSAETLECGYEINMDNIPKVHFSEHKEWETLYNTAWETHKGNIQKAPTKLNPENVYYVDEAFDAHIYAWDTMFMMMFDKYGYHEFPTLNSLNNFYYNQVDSNGKDDGYIPRRIVEKTAQAKHSYSQLGGTNPPLWGWAEWEQYKVHGDKSRFTTEIKGKQIIDRLDSHFDFIKRNRLLENGLYIANGDGNGLDNTPNAGANQSYNDLSFQMYQFAYYLKTISNEIGRIDLVEKYTDEMEELYPNLQKMWSETGTFYFNLASDGKTHTNVVTPTGLWALAANASTEENAMAMIAKKALNSEQMFRPQGLSTVAYNSKWFKPTGGYWRGAFWAPTSFQYIKGLEQYGYNDLAFHEAIRHVNSISEVCLKGAYDRYGECLHTLWENYSSEWDIPGSTEYADTQPSRSHFCGWTGTLAIASILEDIMGLELDAPNNTVKWDMRLVEEYGVEKLWMAGNYINLSAKKRLTDTSPTTITVEADKDFKLIVTNDGTEQIFDVKAGQNNFDVVGKDNSDGSYLNASVTELENSDFNLEDSTANVLFSDIVDTAIDDGLQNQKGENKNKDIYNINTIGYRNATLRKSESVTRLTGETSFEYVKEGEKDGFMVMAKADNILKTMKLVLGVENARAKVNVELSDASQREVTRTLIAGESEQEFVIEIPYATSSENESNYVLVKYQIEEEFSRNANITLKAVSIENGGVKTSQMPKQLTNISLSTSDSTITVNAESAQEYCRYNIYYGTDITNLKSISVDSLPANINGLNNFETYFVTVTGVEDNIESDYSDFVKILLEPGNLTDKEKAAVDWEITKRTVLNGSADFENITTNLCFDVKGAVYGSRIDFSVPESKYGVQPDGKVLIPYLNNSDSIKNMTVKVTYNDEVLTFKEKLIVKATNMPYSDVAENNIKQGCIDLTSDGSIGWIQFNSASFSDYSQKKTDDIWISDMSALTTIESSVVKDAPFSWSCSDMLAGIGPINKYGVCTKGLNSGYTFNLPYRETDKMQELKIYSSAWGGEVTMDFLINGEIKHSQRYEVSADRSLVGHVFDVKYKTHSAADVISVKIYISRDDNENYHASNVLQAITLSETDDEYPLLTTDVEDLPHFTAKLVSGGIDTDISVNVTNLTPKETYANVYFAAYDSIGTLTGISHQRSAVGEYSDAVINLKSVYSESALYYRVFVWDDNQNPITDVIEVTEKAPSESIILVKQSGTDTWGFSGETELQADGSIKFTQSKSGAVTSEKIFTDETITSARQIDVSFKYKADSGQKITFGLADSEENIIFAIRRRTKTPNGMNFCVNNGIITEPKWPIEADIDNYTDYLNVTLSIDFKNDLLSGNVINSEKQEIAKFENVEITANNLAKIYIFDAYSNPAAYLKDFVVSISK